MTLQFLPIGEKALAVIRDGWPQRLQQTVYCLRGGKVAILNQC